MMVQILPALTLRISHCVNPAQYFDELIAGITILFDFCWQTALKSFANLNGR